MPINYTVYSLLLATSVTSWKQVKSVSWAADSVYFSFWQYIAIYLNISDLTSLVLLFLHNILLLRRFIFFFCAVYPGVRATEPIGSKLAEYEAED